MHRPYLGPMNHYIKVPDMLEAMKQTLASGRPKPFRIGYLLADKQRKTGGQYRVAKAMLSTKGKNSGSTEQRMINVELHGTGDIQSVHIDNILYFNDHPTS